jgi:hypothetical protein
VEPRYESIGLALDPLVETVIGHEVDVPKLVRVVYLHVTTSWNQVYILGLVSDLILVVDAEV